MIDNVVLDKVISEIELSHLNKEFLDNFCLQRYFVLTNYPEKFTEVSSLQIYYNRYYWYLKFLIDYQEKNGYDAGIEQQELKILEEGEKYDEIDWNEIEKISIEAKKNTFR